MTEVTLKDSWKQQPMSYTDLQKALKDFGDKCQVKRNAGYATLRTEYHRLMTEAEEQATVAEEVVIIDEAPLEEVQMTAETQNDSIINTEAPVTLTYKELQTALKEYGKRCQVRRNSKREVLEMELARLQVTEPTQEERYRSTHNYRELQDGIKRLIWPSKPSVKLNSGYDVLLVEFLRLTNERRENKRYRKFVEEVRGLLKAQGMPTEVATEVAEIQAQGSEEERQEYIKLLKAK